MVILKLLVDNKRLLECHVNFVTAEARTTPEADARGYEVCEGMLGTEEVFAWRKKNEIIWAYG
jgi:hypothetical protein